MVRKISAFRQDRVGRFANPEFSPVVVEWEVREGISKRARNGLTCLVRRQRAYLPDVVAGEPGQSKCVQAIDGVGQPETDEENFRLLVGSAVQRTQILHDMVGVD